MPPENKNLIKVVPIVNLSALFLIFVTVSLSIYAKLQVGEQSISDVLIYREGARRFWDNTLYSEAFEGVGYWTYPPFGAMFFSPLLAIPVELVEASWAIFSILLISLLLYLGLRETKFFSAISEKINNTRLSDSATTKKTLTIVVVLFLIILLTFSSISLGQIHHHLIFGQVELLLAVLVATDYLVIRTKFPKYYGYLTGVAAAIKLTPIAFVGMYLFLRHYWAVIRSILSLVSVWTVAAILNWQNTYEYFFGGRLSNLAAEMNEFTQAVIPANQSLLGFFLRRNYALDKYGVPLGSGIDYSTMSNIYHIYMVAALLIGIVSVYFARKLHTKGDYLGALTLVGTTVALLSPYSWIYHHIWVLLAFVLFLRKPRTWKIVLLAATALIWTAPAVQIGGLFPSAPQTLRGVFWELFIGIDLVIWAVLAFKSVRSMESNKK